MLFIYPMWDNESQRIGKQKCTPMGYNLHVIAELLGFIGLLLLLGVCVHLGYRASCNSFDKSLYWELTIPFGFAIISRALYHFSWFLASRRGFEYDYDKREASWIENGERVTYRWKSPDRPSE
jgi:hypothetical protein